MNTLHRFYAPDLSNEGDVLLLSIEESHHLTRVLRLPYGTSVRLFDGCGREHLATVKHKDAKNVTVEIGAAIEVNTESTVQVTLAFTTLKGRKTDRIIRDATMLGVTAISPITTGRSLNNVVTLKDQNRWRSISVASAKQCGRTVIPTVNEISCFPEFLDTANRINDQNLILVEPSSGSLDIDIKTSESLRDIARPDTACILVGPEGGWTSGEINQAIDSNFSAITLGPRTLRSETVPLVALAILRFVWEDL